MKILTLLSESFLFAGIEPGELKGLLDENQPEIISYKKGEKIYSSQSTKRQVGFILSGICEVRRERGDGSSLLLNLLEIGDSFGILSVFSDEEFPTTVFAAKNCEIIFFDHNQIRAFANSSQRVSMNLISFMADRIAFLNKKIATFSASSVEERLAALLLTETSRTNSLTLPFSYVKVSEEINAGRASVYRAVASLESAGIIKVNDKKVQIIDQKGLERITKQ